MNSYSRAIVFLISGQVQAVLIFLFAWFAGGWLNDHYPKEFNWIYITLSLGLLACLQMFYVMLRTLGVFKQKNTRDDDKSE